MTVAAAVTLLKCCQHPVGSRRSLPGRTSTSRRLGRRPHREVGQGRQARSCNLNTREAGHHVWQEEELDTRMGDAEANEDDHDAMEQEQDDSQSCRQEQDDSEEHARLRSFLSDIE